MYPITENIFMTRIALSLSSILLAGSAIASPPTHNQLGYAHKIIRSGATMTVTVEITLKPKRSFDSVSVQAGSGVASISPDCSFIGVTVGGSYACRFDVTGKPTDAAMTVNIVAESTPAPHALVHTEVHHLTVPNSAFVHSAAAAATSKHTLISSRPSSK
jgi:hypothetical protein